MFEIFFVYKVLVQSTILNCIAAWLLCEMCSVLCTAKVNLCKYVDPILLKLINFNVIIVRQWLFCL